MTEQEAEVEFEQYVLPDIRTRYEIDGADWVARREAWGQYTDGLCRDGRITMFQYETWGNPSCTTGDGA